MSLLCAPLVRFALGSPGSTTQLALKGSSLPGFVCAVPLGGISSFLRSTASACHLQHESYCPCADNVLFLKTCPFVPYSQTHALGLEPTILTEEDVFSTQRALPRSSEFRMLLNGVHVDSLASSNLIIVLD